MFAIPLVGIALVSLYFISSLLGVAARSDTEITVEYSIRDASSVFLIWGSGNWLPVEPELRPHGTFIKRGVMYTPLTGQDDVYRATLQAPPEQEISYGFLIEKAHPRSDTDRYLWDGPYTSSRQFIGHRNTISSIENRPLYKFAGWIGLAAIVGLGFALLVARYWKPQVPIRNTTTIYLANVVPIALMIIGAEAYLHVTDALPLKVHPLSTYTFTPDPQKGIVPDPVLGWVTDSSRPNINAMGFRDDKEFSAPIRDTKKARVMVLGDSFVWGVGVSAKQNITTYLQSRLGDGFEVYNLAIPGYGISQMYATYQRFKTIIDPDIVVLLFIDNNVLRDLDGGKPTFRLENDALVLRNSLTPTEVAANNMSDASKLGGQILKEVFYAPMAYRVAAAELSALAADVRTSGGRFLAFRIPVPPKGVYASSAWAKAFGWSVLTQDEEVSIVDVERQLTAVPNWEDALYLDDPGSHFTDAGNRAMAQVVAERIGEIDLGTLQKNRETKRAHALRMVSHQIRFPAHSGAEHVDLAWGLNGWQLPTGNLLPADSRISGRVAVTPMRKTDDGFVAVLRLPSGTFMDYSFKVKDAAGKLIEYDDNAGANYRLLFH